MSNETKRVFDTGAHRDNDSGKENYSKNISFLALRRYAKYMTDKGKIYTEGNWMKGIPSEEYVESLLRHMNKFLVERQTGIVLEDSDHLSGMMFNLQGLMHEEEKLKENGKKK